MHASRHVGKCVKLPLTPIPVAGPFNHIGVDIIHLPKSACRNQYAIMFVDYLTKWLEVFPTADESAVTVAHLLVEPVILRHGVPRQLRSDQGCCPKPKEEVYKLMASTR